MTSFFAVHLVLVSLTLGTIIGVYGIRALLVRRCLLVVDTLADRAHSHTRAD